MAAVLACGPTALLSHRDAAMLWNIRRESRRQIDITVPGRGGRRRDGITIHCGRPLCEEDVGVIDRIRVTSLARTLLDLAEVVSFRQLERAWEEADRLRLLDMSAVEATLERNAGRRGAKPLGALVRDWREAPPVRSELERDFLDLCREEGLPPPVVNSVIAGFEVDIAWPEQKLIVELDGRGYHEHAKAFETDRVRDGVLQLDEDFKVLRVTPRRLRLERAAVGASVRRGLR
jgi:hypothetical protein